MSAVMNKIILSLIVITLFICNNLFAYKYGFNETEKGVVVTISNISNSMEDNIEFNLAVPPLSDPKIISKSIYHNNINSIQNQIPLIQGKSETWRKLTVIRYKIDKSDLEKIVTNSTWDSIKLDIDFNSKSPLLLSFSNNYDPAFYSQIGNKRHIKYLSLFENKTKNYSNKTLSSDWYNNNIKYLKINTSKDGIANIKVSDILQNAPEWEGLDIDGLHLLNNGEDYPIYIVSTDKILNYSDDIYFMGKRASGDTTWLDNYTKEEPFYLYYDIQKQPLRLQENETNNANSALEYVYVNKHIEEDRTYFEGREDVFTETTTYEGWYWSKISRVPFDYDQDKEKFVTSIQMPALYNSNGFELKLNYTSLNYGETDPHHFYSVSMLVNKDTADMFTFDYLRRADLVTENFDLIKSGINRLETVSYKIDTNSSLLGIDYIEYKGNFVPEAFNNTFSFETDLLSENKRISIPGYSNNNIYAIDPTNNSIYFPQSKSGVRFAGFAKTGKSKMISLTLNYKSELFAFEGAGLAVEKDTIFSIFTKSSQDQIINELNNLPTGKAFIIAYNSSNAPSKSLLNAVQALGSIKLKNWQNGDSWVFSGIKGETASIHETIISNGTANLSYFYESANHQCLKADLYLKGGLKHKIIVSDENAVELCLPQNVETSTLSALSNEADMIIITHEKFKQSAENFAEFKRSQGIKTYVAKVEDIYKEFNYGKKSPWAIKNFLKYAYAQWAGETVKYLLLIGDASWDARRCSTATISTDYVPVYGYPVSDFWYSLLDGDDYQPEIITGRLPVNENSQVENYLEKAKSYSNLSPASWMKNFLFLSGGLDDGERKYFSEQRFIFLDLLNASGLCPDTSSVNKSDNNLNSEKEIPILRSKINTGALWINYLGHASSQVFDMDGWQVENLNNKDRYGILTTLSCNTGAFAEPLEIQGRNEKYILEKDKGFIGAMGSTYVGFVDVDTYLLYFMYKGLTEKDIHLRALGDLLYYGKSFLIDESKPFVTKFCFGLLGDPSLNLKLGIEPDLYLTNSDYSVSAQNGNSISDRDNTAKISFSLRNYGYEIVTPFDLRLIHQYPQGSDTLIKHFDSFCGTEFIDFDLNVKNKSGEHKVTIEADYNNQTADNDRSNNTFSKSFYVFSGSMLALDPLPYWSVPIINPKFRQIVQPGSEPDLEFYFDLFELSLKDTIEIKRSKVDEITIKENYIQWNPEISLSAGNKYLLRSSTYDPNQDLKGSYLYIPFTAENQSYSDPVNINISSANDFKQANISDLEFDSQGLKLANNQIPFTVMSVCGDYPGSRFGRWGKHIVGEDIYNDSPFNRGITVVVIPMKGINPKGRMKVFDTWQDTLSSANLVNYLRDSVSSEEYILLGTIDQSVRIPKEIIPKLYPKGHIGYLDTLRSVLREFGATMEDKLDTSMSYSFVGYKGADPSSVYESVNFRDTAIITGVLTFYPESGSMTSQKFGPAKSWKDIFIDGDFDAPGVQTNIIINGISPNGDEFILDTIYNSGAYSFESIDAKKYPFLKIRTEMSRNTLKAEHYLKLYDLKFTPVPELAFSKLRTSFESNSLLRGNDAVLNASIENISLRTDSDSLPLNITVKSGSVVQEEKMTSVINADSEINEEIVFDTKNLLYNADFSLFIDPDSFINELFVFNNKNTVQLEIQEDTLKPQTEVYIDSVRVLNRDYITREPEIEIRLFDNSKLPITDPNSILVRFNGHILDEENTLSFKFIPINDGTNLKAVLKIQADTITETNSLMIVYTQDASGNKDTIRIFLDILSEGRIQDVNAFPNPAMDQTRIEFTVKSPEKSGDAVIDIYSFNGEKIKSFTQPIRIGKNTIIWDLRNQYNESISPGIYYYSINIINSLWFKPAYGKISVIK